MKIIFLIRYCILVSNDLTYKSLTWSSLKRFNAGRSKSSSENPSQAYFSPCFLYADLDLAADA
ncbi:hypothetical protein GE573_00510 [Bacillus velezensis]|nr:hypothetical protein GE573_00510 [Bacillus velezensis]